MAKRYKSLDEFLTAHKTKEGEIATNTRIPNIKTLKLFMTFLIAGNSSVTLCHNL